MWLLYAEAFGAMLILILIVWWTMFHGRHKGERDARPAAPTVRPFDDGATMPRSTGDDAKARPADRRQAGNKR